MNKKILLLVLLCALPSVIYAATFPLPKKGDDIVGQTQTAVVQKGENFPIIAERYEVTYTGLVEANPGVNPKKLAPGTVLIIPSQYVLPHVARKGIVINLAELRLYYYPPHQNVVKTYPIGIGVEGWNMSPGLFKIVEKQKDPTWYVPVAVHAELKLKGFNLPWSIPPGPDNPLGRYMLRTSDWSYLIHGCVDPSTVGRRSSSGCFRMYNENVEELFNMVKVGTPLRVIDEPYKIGWQNNKLFLEAHEPLQEQQSTDQTNTPLVAIINKALGRKSADVNWNYVFTLTNEPMGLPQVIGSRG